jgi:spore germination cell wall hydrolase CwlJ-like protein
MSQALAISRSFGGLMAQARQLAAKLWRSHPRETLGFGLLGLAAAVAVGGAAQSQTEAGALRDPRLAPAPPPLLIRELPKAQALQLNQRMPLVHGPNPAAKPFAFSGNSAARGRALECLTSAVYYEAGQESADGQRAVAQVVLNRVRHAAFPATVCGVVYEGSTRATGCQFTFTCDGSLYRGADAAGWRRASAVAAAALSGAVYAPVGWATHYHADYVVPYWAPTLAKSAVVGAHIFYRWAGGWGRPAAFAKNYVGREPNVAALRSAALAAEAATSRQAQSQDIAEAIEDIPGAHAVPLAPSMRGDKRVAVRFNLAAREATEKVEHKAYVEKFEASDNLRWTLSSQAAAPSETPLGKTVAARPAAPDSKSAAGTQP